MKKLKRKLIQYINNKYINEEIKTKSANSSFSQCGEDVVIDYLLRNIGVNQPSYLELGVAYPSRASNTYKFYLKGSKGVLVEADYSMIESIKKVRPRDEVLNLGVAPNQEFSADFYIFDIPGLNTFDKEEALIRQKSGKYKLKKIVTVELKNINSIIKENFDNYPDILSIDIEGLDLEVIKSLDLEKYPIPVICAETCHYSENHIKTKDNRISEYLNRKGYFTYADTYINTIFVYSDWFYKKK